VINALDPPDSRPWDFVAGYLSPEWIVAIARLDDREGLLLLTREPLAVIATIATQGSSEPWRSPVFVGDGIWLTDGPTAMEAWQVAD
jgi:hypothetical protein